MRSALVARSDQGAPLESTTPTSVVGVVFGLGSLLLFWLPTLGLGLALLAVTLSGIALAQNRRTGRRSGWAVAGLVCGCLGALPPLFFIAVFLVGGQ